MAAFSWILWERDSACLSCRLRNLGRESRCWYRRLQGEEMRNQGHMLWNWVIKSELRSILRFSNGVASKCRCILYSGKIRTPNFYGISKSRFERWVDTKDIAEMKKNSWVKCIPRACMGRCLCARPASPCDMPQWVANHLVVGTRVFRELQADRLPCKRVELENSEREGPRTVTWLRHVNHSEKLKQFEGEQAEKQNELPLGLYILS
jgi:hypothetical protein